MTRLPRDGTVEPVSRDQILRPNGEREIFIFPVQLATSKIGSLTRLILTSAKTTGINSETQLRWTMWVVNIPRKIPAPLIS